MGCHHQGHPDEIDPRKPKSSRWQVKGGLGRSTWPPTWRASCRSAATPMLIDCDMPQGTSASWYAMRLEAGRTDNNCTWTPAATWTSIAENRAAPANPVHRPGRPPRIADWRGPSWFCWPTGAGACWGASTWSDRIWATADALGHGDGKPKTVKLHHARMIWTRHRGFTSQAKALTEQTKGRAGHQAAGHRHLGLRVAYVDALGAGLTAAETAGRTSAG